MGNKFPRPNDINFQNTENKIQYHFREVSKIDSPEKVFLSLCTLQSANILISYNFRNDKNLEFKIKKRGVKKNWKLSWKGLKNLLNINI